MVQAENAKVHNKKLISPIWLLPIIALVLAGYLAVKSYKEAGHRIVINFPSAAGMEVNKTLVKYQGLTVGKVVDISINKEAGVDVAVVMDHRAGDLLKDSTKFWLVAPKASITGVEGLDALFSGNYISMLPGEGKSEDNFIAELEAPALLPSDDGLYVRIATDKLGSINIGSPIYYQQVPVGRVINYVLTRNKQVIISGFIEHKYTHLVKDNSRFWNVSGVQAKASLAGVEVTTESLSSILAGGISFSSPQESDLYLPAIPKTFRLFDSFDASNVGTQLQLTAATAEGINAGTQVLYRNIQIGEVSDISLSQQGVTIGVDIYHDYAELVRRDSLFWRQGVELSAQGIRHLDRAITGAAIEFLPGSEAFPSHHFELLSKAPERPALGKTIKLYAKQNPGISKGAAITYKAFTIGQVSEVALAENFKQVEIQANIYPEFQSLLNDRSYFLQSALVDVNASLEGIKVSSGNLSNVLSGELRLVSKGTIKTNSANGYPVFLDQAQADRQLQLSQYQKVVLTASHAAQLQVGSSVDYRSMIIGEVASVEWQAQQNNFVIELLIAPQFKQLINDKAVFWKHQAVSVKADLSGIDINVAPMQTLLKGGVSLGHTDSKIGELAPVRILYDEQQAALTQARYASIRFDSTLQFSVGNAVKYQGFDIGKITDVSLLPSLSSQMVTVEMNGEYADTFLKADSQFYPISAEISLAGVENIDTLLTGSVIGVIPGEGVYSNEFVGLAKAPVSTQLPNGLNVVLTTPTLGSIKIGTPIVYRGINIGQVVQYQLSELANGLDIVVNIEPQYQHLVNSSSKFWDLSGLLFEFGLFSGAKFKSGSLETILSGGIGVATEQSNSADNALQQGQRLPLYANSEESWQTWAPQLLQR
ncbi:MlaD family protein [Paraferrimonas haliotis]|uniref:Multivalent adhesion molecule 7 n=1 Tax=Paraferrimonas haliotis TaxID=2013866 RepID=A0AA37TN93_9GAMM|nr:MlaD family protein [Paraferrimonas haliotis]GLS84637.1 multivalent adhesion molecule 7 [Paraferrimonas haliotis]